MENIEPTLLMEEVFGVLRLFSFKPRFRLLPEGIELLPSGEVVRWAMIHEIERKDYGFREFLPISAWERFCGSSIKYGKDKSIWIPCRLARKKDGWRSQLKVAFEPWTHSYIDVINKIEWQIKESQQAASANGETP